MTDADKDADNGNPHPDESRWSALMSSAQAGNEADYRCLLTELSRAIKHYLLSRIGHRHFIEDCVQESLIAVHEARHTYNPRRRFRPWLFAIVRHKTIDCLRRQRVQQTLVQQQGQRLQELQEVPDELDTSLNRGRLLACLSPQHREILTLTKFVGLSTAETAEHLRISEAAVKVRVHRAIGNLTRLMEADA